jgi:predicted ATPase
MRLRKLELRSFKNLVDFEITFDRSLVTVLVGPNGTGKSNVLEALVVIFRDLDLANPPSLAYRLEYECRGAEVVIDADPDRRGRHVIIDVDGERWTPDRFSRRRGNAEYLPGFIFGYYSGPSNRMESHFDLHQRRFATDLREGVDRPLRPLLYARQVHSQFVLLSFFAAHGPNPELLAKYLRITELDSVLFELKRPEWYDPNRSSSRSDAGDLRFWGARGVVSDFLAKIHDIALAPIRLSKPRDNVYLYLAGQAELRSLAAGYENQAEFFKALESLYISDLIEDVRTRVVVKNSITSLTFRELSEGEQQLLTVLGLLKFTEGHEGLILLDEPDTHLNPVWSLDYVSLLKDHVDDPDTTQIVMSTHDPLVVSGLLRNQVRLMRNEDLGRVTAEIPDEDPRGMGVAGLLTSELYGLRSQLDSETLSLLDQKRFLATKETLSRQEREELAMLNRQLEGLDFSRVTRDPLYKPYVDAMSRLEMRLGLRKATLSPAEIEERADLAAEVVTELLEKLGDNE